MFRVQRTAKFERDVRALARKHYNLMLLRGVIDLVAEDTERSRSILKQPHNMHSLKGVWSGSNECHVANAGDWLVI